jgi:AAA15 family ATPase/GTPase
LGIALALVNAQDGFLIIDEIESGLHYSVQLKTWELIFRLAEELKIQVFATTHSDDCVKAFQYVAQRDEAVEGVLIRLGKWKEFSKAIIFDEERLTTAVEGQIEIR